MATANIGAEQKFSLDFGVADICKYSLDIFARGDHYYFAAGECNNAHDFNKIIKINWKDGIASSFLSMHKFKFIFTLLLVQLSLLGRSQVILTGYVSDESTSSVLVGAIIQTCESGYGTTTDAFGYYKLIIDSLPVCIKVSYIGFETKRSPF